MLEDGQVAIRYKMRCRAVWQQAPIINLQSSMFLVRTLEKKIFLVLHGVCKLEFYHTTANQSPFHKQRYRKDAKPEVCSHPELPLSLDPSVTCAKYCVQYKKNEKWLKCTMCDQWFHEKYFYLQTLIYIFTLKCFWLKYVQLPD